MELKYYAEKAIKTDDLSDSAQPEPVALNPGGVRE